MTTTTNLIVERFLEYAIPLSGYKACYLDFVSNVDDSTPVETIKFIREKDFHEDYLNGWDYFGMVLGLSDPDHEEEGFDRECHIFMKEGTIHLLTCDRDQDVTDDPFIADVSVMARMSFKNE